MKHTNGPWKIAKWDQENVVDGFITVITDSRGVGIAEFQTFGKNKKVEANAKLISKAPEMAELIKDLMDIRHKVQLTPEMNLIIHKARVISKSIK